MLTSDLDYHLPLERIAQEPAAQRCNSRLLVLHRADGLIEHRRFLDIPEYLQSGDCLVLNNSKVIPARFYLRRQTGGVIEGLFLQTEPDDHWHVLLKNAGRLKFPETLDLYDPVSKQTLPIHFTTSEKQQNGHWLLRADAERSHLDILEQFGQIPLPPYIHRDKTHPDPRDRARYQTVYADPAGSVAAPTAGLHFTPELLEQIKVKGVDRAEVTLHVGLGTFKPIEVETVEAHTMHAESYELDSEDATRINHAKETGHRVIAVGTTSVRTLESLAESHRVKSGRGQTNLFITPGYHFLVPDALITNFHLPCSSLLALVMAFAGRENILKAYEQAIKEEYRFYSYGDAMLIL